MDYTDDCLGYNELLIQSYTDSAIINRKINAWGHLISRVKGWFKDIFSVPEAGKTVCKEYEVGQQMLPSYT